MSPRCGSVRPFPSAGRAAPPPLASSSGASCAPPPPPQLCPGPPGSSSPASAVESPASPPPGAEGPPSPRGSGDPLPHIYLTPQLGACSAQAWGGQGAAALCPLPGVMPPPPRFPAITHLSRCCYCPAPPTPGMAPLVGGHRRPQGRNQRGRPTGSPIPPSRGPGGPGTPMLSPHPAARGD